MSDPSKWKGFLRPESKLSMPSSLRGSKSEAILKGMERKGLSFFQSEAFLTGNRGVDNENMKMKGCLGTRLPN